MYKQPLVIGNSHAFRKHKAIMEMRKRNNLKKTALFHMTICLIVMFLASKIKDVNGKYFSIDHLLRYELIERDGDCNIFINGFNEKMKLCPEDFYVDDNGEWKDVKNIADYRGY